MNDPKRCSAVWTMETGHLARTSIVRGGLLSHLNVAPFGRCRVHATQLKVRPTQWRAWLRWRPNRYPGRFRRVKARATEWPAMRNRSPGRLPGPKFIHHSTRTAYARFTCRSPCCCTPRCEILAR
ncbi:hypothetical protein MRX96_003799 [Rhipicephalus microplus]